MFSLNLISCLILIVISGHKSVPHLRTYRSPNRTLFRAIVNPENNDVIVGARNAVIRLAAENLNEIDSLMTGPVSDRTECPPPTYVCQQLDTLYDNDMQMVYIRQSVTDNLTYVVACGTVIHEMCYRVQSDDWSLAVIRGDTNLSQILQPIKKRIYSFMSDTSFHLAYSFDTRNIENQTGTFFFSFWKLQGKIS